jgi:hypothetical protein
MDLFGPTDFRQLITRVKGRHVASQQRGQSGPCNQCIVHRVSALLQPLHQSAVKKNSTLAVHMLLGDGSPQAGAHTANVGVCQRVHQPLSEGAGACIYAALCGKGRKGDQQVGGQGHSSSADLPSQHFNGLPNLIKHTQARELEGHVFFFVFCQKKSVWTGFKLGLMECVAQTLQAVVQQCICRTFFQPGMLL